MSNQSTWKDRIKAAASASAVDEAANPLVKTLEEFRATLDESPWIRAELQPKPPSRRLVLVVSPKYRRDISAMMLTFSLTSSGVIISGAEDKVFDDEEKLRSYLVEFVEKTAFPDTVAEFRALQNEAVHGMLRVKSLWEDDSGDVAVLVDSGDHKELARRALANQLDHSVKVGVVIEEHFAAGEFDENVNYAYLESGGFGLRIVNKTGSGSMFHLHGDVVALSDLPG